jgi:hypothetical protein
MPLTTLLPYHTVIIVIDVPPSVMDDDPVVFYDALTALPALDDSVEADQSLGRCG